MNIKGAVSRLITHNHATRPIDPVRGIFTARAGSAPAELALILGFVAPIAATSFVFVEDSLTENYAALAEKIEIASINMPNPLGGGNGNGKNK